MFEFTKKNHFRFGYAESGWFRNRSSATETFVCEYGRAEKILDFRTANLEAARYIASIATDDISIMLSGGADSEIAAWAFLDARIPFRAAIMRFSGGLNQHDTDYADRFCQQHNIPVDYYDLDVIPYLKSDDFEDTIRRYQTTVERATALWLAKQIPNFAILGQGEPVVTRSFGQWWFQEKERICSWNKYWIFNNIPGCPGFHQFSPDQIFSCLTDDLVQNLVYDRTDYYSNDKIKHMFYKKHYPDFEIRTKFTGHEKLGKYKHVLRSRVFKTFPHVVGEWQIPYQQAISDMAPLPAVRPPSFQW